MFALLNGFWIFSLSCIECITFYLDFKNIYDELLKISFEERVLPKIVIRFYKKNLNLFFNIVSNIAPE